MTRPTGGLNRADFLRLGLAVGPAGLVAACGWDGGSVLEPKLRGFSRVNDWVGERILLFESADVVLVKSDVADVARTVRLSRATTRNIRQNLFFAFAYNLVALPVAAGILYPVFGVLLSPAIAAGAMAASSISVVLNALRLRRFRVV